MPKALSVDDAVQLACTLTLNVALAGLELPALTFITADTRLLQAAEAEGLPADDPNQHR